MALLRAVSEHDDLMTHRAIVCHNRSRFYLSRSDYPPNFNSLSKVYDQSVIPRIILVIIMAIFSMVALVNLIAHTGESKKVTNFNIPNLLSVILRRCSFG